VWPATGAAPTAGGAAGYFPISHFGNACCSSAMPASALRVNGTGETGVMVGCVGTARCKTPFPEASASHHQIPRDLVPLVATLSYGRNPLTIGVISRR